MNTLIWLLTVLAAIVASLPMISVVIEDISAAERRRQARLSIDDPIAYQYELLEQQSKILKLELQRITK